MSFSILKRIETSATDAINVVADGEFLFWASMAAVLASERVEIAAPSFTSIPYGGVFRKSIFVEKGRRFSKIFEGVEAVLG